MSTRLRAITYYAHRDNMRVAVLVDTRFDRDVCATKHDSSCLMMSRAKARRSRGIPLAVRDTQKKTRPGWPREYSQTPSDEGNKQL
ncbi:TPA: hypothetical protein ACT5B2_005337 [Burkholderia cenocepacia]|uniref:hypothetical protein n=1 Tax=Burkholderia cenocepacia TaxID=95486 RepID=UPI002AB7EE72|nr:hypothetical protein [Burkholderia cenocepacia]